MLVMNQLVLQSTLHRSLISFLTLKRSWWNSNEGAKYRWSRKNWAVL